MRTLAAKPRISLTGQVADESLSRRGGMGAGKKIEEEVEAAMHEKAGGLIPTSFASPEVLYPTKFF
jgi:hypothetical protein